MSISKIATVPNAMNTTKAIYQMWRSSKKTKLGVQQFPLCIECRERYFILASHFQESHEQPLSLSEDVTASEKSFNESEATIADSIVQTHNVEKCACCVNMTTHIAEITNDYDDEYDVNDTTGIYSEVSNEKPNKCDKNFAFGGYVDELLESIQNLANTNIGENLNFKNIVVDNYNDGNVYHRESIETVEDLEPKKISPYVVSTVSEPVLNGLTESKPNPLPLSVATSPLEPFLVSEPSLHGMSSQKISIMNGKIASIENSKITTKTISHVYLLNDNVFEAFSASSELSALPRIEEFEVPTVDLLSKSTGNTAGAKSLPEITIPVNALKINSETAITPKIEHLTADISEISESDQGTSMLEKEGASQIGPNWSISSISNVPFKSVSFEIDNKSEAIQRYARGNTPRNSPVVSAAIEPTNNETLEELFETPLWKDDNTNKVKQEMNRDEVYPSCGIETVTAPDIRRTHEFLASPPANAPFSLHKKYIRTKASFSERTSSRHQKSVLSRLSMQQSWVEQTNKIRRKSDAAKTHVIDWWNRISQKIRKI
ncbi:hypothetical protein HK100_001185 [Physocladia obscura]|uniref:Uncharacterized protein n=1 Tax=Physocladia obscura TaxID=109957 RepID=A0AAD5T3A7_9FUNG|nr:hypothetical protein HK100_001185 [Physocladia obscura]